jgi:cellulose synthase/poly-beta-1,6-N-acetylglucosamine synthase-like glycosyltransferase
MSPLLSIQIILSLCVLLWVGQIFVILKFCLTVPRLKTVECVEPKKWPKLSVVIPACNEAKTIGPALESLQKQDYPDFEIIVINDRSTDSTAEIIKSISDTTSQIVSIDISELPEGWLGKVHALQRGLEKAQGEWVLFADADVIFEPGTFRRVVALSIRDKLDHFSLLPDLSSGSPMANFVIACSLRYIALSQRPWYANDPEKEDAIGTGAFNLVRRDFWLKTKGFEWLKMEVADDIGLAYLISISGGRSRFFLARALVRVPWYPTLSDCIKGLEKNAFAQVAQFNVFKGLFASLVVLSIPMTPILSLILLPGVFGQVLCGLCILTAFVAAGISRRYGLAGFWHMFGSFIFGEAVLFWIILRSTVLGGLRGGMIWRGTVYPSEQLRSGRRVKF